jgi:hypothetical protein
VSHIHSPEADRRAETLAGASTLLAAVMAVIVFFPAEGHILVPIHAAMDGLLGQASFMLPLGLALAAGLGFVRRACPDLVLPRRRLTGLALITIAAFPAEHLLGQSTGVVGGWFTEFLIELVGGPCTVLLTLSLIMLGAALALDLDHMRRRIAAR